MEARDLDLPPLDYIKDEHQKETISIVDGDDGIKYLGSGARLPTVFVDVGHGSIVRWSEVEICLVWI